MPKRSTKKMPSDVNMLAKALVDRATGAANSSAAKKIQVVAKTTKAKKSRKA